ncbi:MAG: hypothetical protein JO285_15450, partial [Kutzneria sp.]|nr:hypothetical protein [Kutzneria sp.]
IRRRADESFGPGRFQFPRPVFTPRALRALKLSLRETLELRQHSIGTEHLLLGLLAEGEGTAVKVLDALDVDRTELRPAILARISPQGS